ncbi:MAG: PRC-barrel domain-containing protein [Candidatus Dormibacteria bacterium]
MLRLGEVIGRAVVDMEAAEKVGSIKEVVLDFERRRVAGFIVEKGQSLLGEGHQLMIPAASVHSVGPDAVTINGPSGMPSDGEVTGMPRRRDLLGRKVVGQGGKMYGHISDVLIDAGDGRIIGYEVGEAPGVGALENLFGAARHHEREYVRADADLRLGTDLVIVPDDAVVSVDQEHQVAETTTYVEAAQWSRQTEAFTPASAAAMPASRMPEAVYFPPRSPETPLFNDESH